MEKFKKYFSHKGITLNIKEALKECPDIFKQDSPFTFFVVAYIRKKGVVNNSWDWKIPEEERDYWHKRFDYLVLPPGYDIGDRIMFGGWMLSEMLSKVPII